MTALKALGLTSTTTQAAGRFVFGYAFAEGELPTGFHPHIDTPAYSSYIVNRWPDGSVRLATFTGTTSLTANVEKQVNVVSRNYAPAASTGTALTTANIAACGATATVQFGSLGTVSLAGAALVQVHYADAQMICAEYRAKLGTTGLSVQFFVWLFADGLWYQRVTPWNGFFMGGFSEQDYVPTVTIDGTMVYNNGGVAYKHTPHTWYTFTRWSNGSDITPRHDAAKLIDSGVIENIGPDSPRAANTTYFNSVSNYVPGANLGHTPQMGGTGAQDGIGMLPKWDAGYLVNHGEKAAYLAVIANAHAIGSYSVHHCDPATLRSIKLSDYPTHSQFGPGAGGGGNYGSAINGAPIPDGGGGYLTQYIWELAHHTAPPKLAAVLTGDPFYMQICQYVAAACYLSISPQTGRDGPLRVVGQQPRGVAWTLRSASDAAVVCPTSQASLYEHAAWFGNQVVAYSDYIDTVTGVGGFKIGMIDQYDNYQAGNNFAGCPFWQEDFIATAIGQALMMRVGDGAARTKALNFLAYLAKNAEWRTAGQYFTYCAPYYFLIPKSTAVSDISPLRAINANPASAADIFNVSLDAGQIATLGDNTLHTGGSSTTGPGSYLDQFMCALAYFCNFNLPGAAAGRTKILGATNAAPLTDPVSRGETPMFAIAPLTVTHTPTFNAVDSGSGAIVTTTGPSIRVDTLPLHTAGFFVTKQPGIGIPLSQIVGGGSDGTSPIYDAIQAAGGTVSSLSEIRLVAAAGTHGTYSPDETGGGVYSGDGSSDTVNVDYYLDGAQINSAPMYFGTAPTGTVSSVVVSPSSATGSTTFTAVVNGTGGPSQAVTWTRSGSAGSINATTGVFTAPAATSSVQTIIITATSTQDSSKAGTATVSIAASGSTVSGVVVTPSSGTLFGGALRQHSATVNGVNGPSQAVTWTTDIGSISTSGLLTAPAATSVQQNGTVSARSQQDNNYVGTATFIVPASGTVSPVCNYLRKVLKASKFKITRFR